MIYSLRLSFDSLNCLEGDMMSEIVTANYLLINIKKDFDFMKEAYDEALEAFRVGEVPIGAVIVSDKGEIIARAFNTKEMTRNSVNHAEINAITLASERLNNWRLDNHTIYTTVEPCLMCMGAISHARLKRLVFGAYDEKFGALSLGYKIFEDKRLNHNFSVTGGVGQKVSSELMQMFFLKLRSSKSKN